MAIAKSSATGSETQTDVSAPSIGSGALGAIYGRDVTEVLCFWQTAEQWMVDSHERLWASAGPDNRCSCGRLAEIVEPGDRDDERKVFPLETESESLVIFSLLSAKPN